ncbi:MAG: amino acid-binding protein [Deltaproteobacteria bacterium]|nr:MAG: amino acid-binding protein [Deltaproteobacteria bacterium]
MPVKEIDLALSNPLGELSVVSEILDSDGINIIAFYIYTKGERGRLRFIANDPDRATNVLRARGYRTRMGEVIACERPNHPGGLNAILKPLREEGINVDYLYPCLPPLGASSSAVLILGAASKDRERILNVLRENWIRVVDEELYRM